MSGLDFLQNPEETGAQPGCSVNTGLPCEREARLTRGCVCENGVETGERREVVK